MASADDHDLIGHGGAGLVDGDVLAEHGDRQGLLVDFGQIQSHLRGLVDGDGFHDIAVGRATLGGGFLQFGLGLDGELGRFVGAGELCPRSGVVIVAGQIHVSGTKKVTSGHEFLLFRRAEADPDNVGANAGDLGAQR